LSKGKRMICATAALTTQFYDTHTGGRFSTAAGAVPEPSTWAMLLMGFIGLGVMARRRAGAALG
jgi:PEP-CTERM motif